MNFKESETLELKERYTPEIKKELVAFANSKGGKIYLGISDQGNLLGIDEPDFVMQQISNSIRDAIRPDLTMFTKIELLEKEGKKYIKITIEEATNKPYYLTDKGLRPSGVYIRSASSSAPASEEHIRSMIRLTDGDSFEKNRSLVQELTFTSLFNELAERNMKFSNVQMENLGIITQDQVYTNLGLLLSEECPYSIKVAIFQGLDKNIFKDRKEINGSIFNQLREAYQLIDFYNATQASFYGLRRVDRRNYPEIAIREALLNSLIHRDYSFSGSILINMYDDRLEIVSLGGLVPGLSLKAAMIGASQTRNERLANLFYRLKLTEAYGTGISKIISSYKESGLEPVFESTKGAFRVTLPNINYNKALQDADASLKNQLRERKEEYNLDNKDKIVLSLFEEKKEIGRRDVEKALGIATTHAVNTVKDLLNRDLIEKIGQGKNTRYIKKL